MSLSELRTLWRLPAASMLPAGSRRRSPEITCTRQVYGQTHLAGSGPACGVRLRRLETRLPETSSFPFNQPGVICPSPMPNKALNLLDS